MAGLARTALSAALGSSLLALAGCAAPPAPRSAQQPQPGANEAQAPGRLVGTFTLIDGSRAWLQESQGRYALRLQHWHKAVGIDRATDVRVLSTAAASGRSVLVLEKTEPGCARRVQVIAIRGPEVASWEMGDCQTQARVTAGGDSVTIDFPGARDARSYAYRDARMYRTDLAALSSPPLPDGAAAGATGAPSGRRYVPGPPVVSKAPPPIPSKRPWETLACLYAVSPLDLPLARAQMSPAGSRTGRLFPWQVSSKPLPRSSLEI